MINTTTANVSVDGRYGMKSAVEKPSANAKKQAKVKPFSKKVLVDLFRGLGSMLRAQINTADALKYYSNDLPDKALADTLLQIREDIAKGMN
ncbi:MAG: hypothetical protein RLZ22_1578, partial [Verrucomicrobiota bacterium]